MVGSVSEAVAAGFRGQPRLAPAVAGLKWAYQPMLNVDDVATKEEEAEVRRSELNTHTPNPLVPLPPSQILTHLHRNIQLAHTRAEALP